MDSTINGAGRGLFVTIAMHKGTIIADYRGKRLGEDEINAEGYEGTYAYHAPDLPGTKKYI